MRERRRPRLPARALLVGAAMIILPALVAVPAAHAVPPRTTVVSGWKTTTLTFRLNGTWRSSTIVGGPARRLVSLQRRSGAAWVTVASARTSLSHVVAFSRKLTAAGTFSYRLLVPAVKGWKAAATKARTVTVLKPAPPATPPVTFTGSFHGSGCVGRCNQGNPAGPPITLTWDAAGVTFARTSSAGDSATYALTGLQVSWHVSEDIDTYGCTLSASGSWNGVDSLALFSGQGDMHVDTADAAHRWTARFVVNARGDADAVKRRMMWAWTGAGCTGNEAVLQDYSQVFWEPTSTVVLTTQGWQQGSTEVGWRHLASPRHVTGTTSNLDPSAWLNARTFTYDLSG